MANLWNIFPPIRTSKRACSEGERKFVYKWNGHRFVLDDIIDVPPAKGGN